jgi:hypothetical protein
MFAVMTRGEDERPWMPGPDAPWNVMLVNPQGTRHLAFDERRGTWLRIFQDHREQPLRASEAVLLRPSDVDTVIKLTMTWCLREGRASDRASVLIDDLASGVKAAIEYFAERAGHR